jgi:hypothetical protein
MTHTEKHKIPPWAEEPLTQLIDSLGSTIDFYYLTIEGLKSIIHQHEIMVMGDARIEELRLKVLQAGGTLKKTEDAEAKEKNKERNRKQAKARAERAQREVSNGFPVLHSQHVVSIWSAIECFVEDVLVAWVANDPEFMQSERIQKIKIPLADFDRISESERKYFLISELQRDQSFSRRNEIEKFELLLALAGLSGNIEAEIKRDLIELGHVRNVLLHRRGIADAKFVQACQWVKVRVGAHVQINSTTVERFVFAAVSYAESMRNRMEAYFEIDGDGEIEARRVAHPSPEPK